MGKVVNYRAAEGRETAPGVRQVPLVDWFDGVEMMASVLRLGPGARHEGKVPQGSDQYLYMLTGAGRIAAAAGGAALAADDWVLLQEGQEFTISGEGELLSVVVPPPGAGKSSSGFAQGLKCLRIADQPVVDLPKEKKRRIYLANDKIAGSNRGHAMIVRYTGDALTPRHHHPNAESLFVVLTGKVAFTVDGQERVLARGEAAFFPTNDSHGLKSADGRELSFLELHVPGAFVTEYDEK
jgi:quercetin dioxygenase-like cupin family protein